MLFPQTMWSFWRYFRLSIYFCHSSCQYLVFQNDIRVSWAWRIIWCLQGGKNLLTSFIPFLITLLISPQVLVSLMLLEESGWSSCSPADPVPAKWPAWSAAGCVGSQWEDVRFGFSVDFIGICQVSLRKHVTRQRRGVHVCGNGQTIQCRFFCVQGLGRKKKPKKNCLCFPLPTDLLPSHPNFSASYFSQI